MPTPIFASPGSAWPASSISTRLPPSGRLATDPDPAVRRECAIQLHRSKSPKAPALWAQLAEQHDGHDRWYLEALGIGADGNWDAFLAAYLTKVGNQWNTPAGRDIIWRSRAKVTPDLLVQILSSPATTSDQQPRTCGRSTFCRPVPRKPGPWNNCWRCGTLCLSSRRCGSRRSICRPGPRPRPNCCGF